MGLTNKALYPLSGCHSVGGCSFLEFDVMENRGRDKNGCMKKTVSTQIICRCMLNCSNSSLIYTHMLINRAS
jgi:hypothetical protein